MQFEHIDDDTFGIFSLIKQNTITAYLCVSMKQEFTNLKINAREIGCFNFKTKTFRKCDKISFYTHTHKMANISSVLKFYSAWVLSYKLN